MGKGNIPPDIPGFSIPYQKGEAVLNGTVDFSSIQDAIDHASTGDAVLVGPGTFEENVVIDVQDLTLRGVGVASLVDGGVSGRAILVEADGVTIRDMGAQTTKGGGSAHGAIEDVAGVSDLTVDTVTVPESDDDGFVVRADDLTLMNITVEQADDNGIVINATCDRFKIADCDIRTDVTDVGINAAGDDGTISGTIVDSVGANGVILAGNDITCTGNQVMGMDGGSHGIDVNGTNCVVVGNRVSVGGSGNPIDTAGATTPTVNNNNTAARA